MWFIAIAVPIILKKKKTKELYILFILNNL